MHDPVSVSAPDICAHLLLLVKSFIITVSASEFLWLWQKPSPSLSSCPGILQGHHRRAWLCPRLTWLHVLSDSRARKISLVHSGSSAWLIRIGIGSRKRYATGRRENRIGYRIFCSSSPVLFLAAVTEIVIHLPQNQTMIKGMRCLTYFGEFERVYDVCYHCCDNFFFLW